MVSEPTGMDPHVVRKEADETGGEFVRFESTMYPSPTDAPAAETLSHELWGLDNDFEHVHPEQRERWEVVAGKLRIEVNGDERTLTEGEDVSLPSDVPHRHYNPTDQPIRVVWERYPAHRSEEWAESVYALAQAGGTNEEGVPNPLQIAVWIDAYPDEAYPTAVPVRLQQSLSSLIAPIGRSAGFEPRYTRE
jgi:mannose-6-phosphate isomerase-like protein (cupin superfamily)